VRYEQKTDLFLFQTIVILGQNFHSRLSFVNFLTANSVPENILEEPTRTTTVQEIATLLMPSLATLMTSSVGSFPSTRASWPTSHVKSSTTCWTSLATFSRRSGVTNATSRATSSVTRGGDRRCWITTFRNRWKSEAEMKTRQVERRRRQRTEIS